MGLIQYIGITGSSGFVGTNLTNYLSKFSYRFIGVSRSNGLNVIPYSSVSRLFNSGLTSFIHLAGNNHNLSKNIPDKEYFKVNTELTKKLFNQFLDSTCEIFIYMSSVKAAADEVEGLLEESVIPNPVTAYGKSKIAAEEYILSKQLPENKRVYILRPCMIHGPNNKGNLNLLHSFVKKGIPYPFGAYENLRSFVSVENLCFVIKELIENKKIPCGVYNVADDQPLSTNELVETMGVALDKKANIWKLPKGLVKIIAKIGDILPLPVNTERLQKLTENYVVSNQKLKKALGKELPLTAKEGLLKTLHSFEKESF